MGKILQKLTTASILLITGIQPFATSIVSATVVQSPKQLTLTSGYGGNVEFLDSYAQEDEFTPGSTVELMANTMVKQKENELDVLEDSGYRLSKVQVVGKSGKVTTATISEDRQHATFEMPSESATVYPIFESPEDAGSTVRTSFSKNINWQVSDDVDITPDKPMGYEIGDNVTLAVKRPKNYIFDTFMIEDSNGKIYDQKLTIENKEAALVTVEKIEAPISVKFVGHKVGESLTEEILETKAIENNIKPFDIKDKLQLSGLDITKVNPSKDPQVAGALQVKQTFFDKDFVGDSDTLESIYKRDSENLSTDLNTNKQIKQDTKVAQLGQSDSNIPLYNVDDNSKYYIGYLESGLKDAIFEIEYAENNIKGISLNGIYYDKETGFVYVEKRYFTKEFAANALMQGVSPVQMQVAYKVDKNAPLEKTATITVDETFRSHTPQAKVIQTTWKTNSAVIHLGEDKFLDNIDVDKLVVLDNGMPILQSRLRYNSDTHMLEVKDVTSKLGQLDVYIVKSQKAFFGLVETVGEKRIKESNVTVSEEDLLNQLLDQGVQAKVLEKRSNDATTWSYSKGDVTLVTSRPLYKSEYFGVNMRTGYVNMKDVGLDLPDRSTLALMVQGGDNKKLATWIYSGGENEVPNNVYEFFSHGAGNKDLKTDTWNVNAPNSWVYINNESGNLTWYDGGSFRFSGDFWYLLSCTHIDKDGTDHYLKAGWDGQRGTVHFRVHHVGNGWVALGVLSPSFNGQSGTGFIVIPHRVDTPTPPTPVEPPAPKENKTYGRIYKKFTNNGRSTTTHRWAKFRISMSGAPTQEMTISSNASSSTADSEAYGAVFTLPYRANTPIVVEEVETSSGYELSKTTVKPGNLQTTRLVRTDIKNDSSESDPYGFNFENYTTTTYTPPSPPDPPKPPVPTPPATVVKHASVEIEKIWPGTPQATNYRTATFNVWTKHLPTKQQVTLSNTGLPDSSISSKRTVTFEYKSNAPYTDTVYIEEVSTSAGYKLLSGTKSLTIVPSTSRTYKESITIRNEADVVREKTLTAKISKSWVAPDKQVSHRTATFEVWSKEHPTKQTITVNGSINGRLLVTEPDRAWQASYATGSITFKYGLGVQSDTIYAREVSTTAPYKVDPTTHSKPINLGSGNNEVTFSVKNTLQTNTPPTPPTPPTTRERVVQIRVNKRWIGSPNVTGLRKATFEVWSDKHPTKQELHVSGYGQPFLTVNENRILSLKYSGNETNDTIYVREKATSVGYDVLPETLSKSIVIEDGKEIGFDVVNHPSAPPTNHKVKLRIKKIWKAGENITSDRSATFKIWSTHIKEQRVTITTTGSTNTDVDTIKDIELDYPSGVLSDGLNIQEISASEGYAVDTQVKRVSITPGSNPLVPVEASFINNPLQPEDPPLLIGRDPQSNKFAHVRLMKIFEHGPGFPLRKEATFEIVAPGYSKKITFVANEATDSEKVGSVFKIPFPSGRDTMNVSVRELSSTQPYTSRPVMNATVKAVKKGETSPAHPFTFTARNTVPKGYLRIRKNWEAGGPTNRKATFEVTANGNVLQQVTLDSSALDGKASTTTSQLIPIRIDPALKSNQVTIKEVTTSSPYKLAAPVTITVQESHLETNPLQVTITNSIPLHPTITTTARDALTESNVGSIESGVQIYDDVHYKDLEVGKPYEIQGTLMVKSTGQPLVVGGKQVTVTKTFTPTTKDGTETVLLQAKSLSYAEASILAGQDIVAYEKLLQNGKVVATHEDLNAASQTIHFANVKTIAKEKGTNAKTITAGGKKTIVDTVKVNNLSMVKRSTYTIIGQLVRKSTGQIITTVKKDVNTDSEIPMPFSDVDVEFTVDTTNLANDDLVIYEAIAVNNKLIAVHRDINDKDQTVHIKSTTKDLPTTGTLGIIVAVVATTSLLAVVGILAQIKKKQK